MKYRGLQVLFRFSGKRLALGVRNQFRKAHSHRRCSSAQGSSLKGGATPELRDCSCTCCLLPGPRKARPAGLRRQFCLPAPLPAARRDRAPVLQWKYCSLHPFLQDAQILLGIYANFFEISICRGTVFTFPPCRAICFTP